MMGSRKTASLVVEPGASKAIEQREGRRRVQIDFSPTAYARLDAIRERSEAQSNAETVRNALRLYDWFLRQRDDGYEVRLVKGDEERAVELPVVNEPEGRTRGASSGSQQPRLPPREAQMAWREDLDRTLELPAELLDDLAPLESTASPTEPRGERTQTVSRPLSLDESVEAVSESTEREVASELASRRLSIARREQRHRHALEMAELRHRHDSRRRRVQQEARILGAVLVLVLASGLAWIAMPVADAAQIVFTTSFGLAVGYLGGRSRRSGVLPG